MRTTPFFRALCAGTLAIATGGAIMRPGFAQSPGEVNATAALPPTWTQGPQPTAPSGIAGANSNLNAQGFYTNGPLPQPTPGSIVVRMNGRVAFYVYAENSSADTQGGRKAQPYGTKGFFRFYPGVDGMTASGLRYGAAVELRVRSSFSNASATSGGSSAATSGSGNAATLTTYVPGKYVYVRRAFSYIGGDWGAIHFGQDDGSISLMDAGITTFQTYNAGGMNEVFTPDLPAFPFISGIANDYTTSKIVYLSPQLAGFDASAEYEPDDNPLNDAIPGATAFSPQLSSGTLLGEVARRRNTVQIAGRYQGDYGPFGLYVTAGYVKSGVVQPYDISNRFDGLSAWEAGLAVEIAGARVGGNVLAGAMNSQMALKPDGAANMIAYIVGAQYTLGPATIGGSYMNILSAGAVTASGAPLGSQRRAAAGQIGGTYVIAPGLISYLSANYGQRYQGGVDLNTGLLGPAANNVKVLGAELGLYVRW